MNQLSYAPWTASEVESLNAYQADDYVHPFTYGEGPDQVNLIATESGWIARPGGPVVQNWAHTFMVNWQKRNTSI